MSEKTQEKTSILTQAIKAVKGENTQQLMENFTSEMTLVAEGLFEDQAEINRRMDNIIKENDSRIQNLGSRIDSVDKQREEDLKDLEKRIETLKNTVNELEKKNKGNEKKNGRNREKNFTFNKLIILVSIICATSIIVVLLTKLL